MEPSRLNSDFARPIPKRWPHQEFMVSTDLMALLAKRKGLCSKVGLDFVSDPIWPYLEIQNPMGIARLIGEAKQFVQRGQVFLRGQTGHHQQMVPSLLRGADETAVRARRRAQRELVAAIRRRIDAKRFQRKNLPALLQHYGFQTTWLDAVDNLFVATWFATHELPVTAGFYKIAVTSATHGWLYLLRSRPLELRCVDLRRDHHPLSLRPHIQHGVSLAATSPDVIDLRRFVVAPVKFPVTKWTVGGTLFENSFLIPSKTADHTLHLLLKHNVNEIAALVEAKHHVPKGTLGRVRQCCRAA